MRGGGGSVPLSRHSLRLPTLTHEKGCWPHSSEYSITLTIVCIQYSTSCGYTESARFENWSEFSVCIGCSLFSFMTNPNSRAAGGWTKRRGHCPAPWCASVLGDQYLYCTGVQYCTVREYCKQKCVHFIIFWLVVRCGACPPRRPSTPCILAALPTALALIALLLQVRTWPNP